MKNQERNTGTDKLNPRNPIDKGRMDTREKVSSWHETLKRGAKITGDICTTTAEIGATGISTVGSIIGHTAGGIKNAVLNTVRAYRSHRNDSPPKE